MAAERFVEVRDSRDGGRLHGALRQGEDHEALIAALRQAPERVLDGTVELLLHERDRPSTSVAELEAARERKLDALRGARLKRYVFSLPTAAGLRIIKVAEITSLGNAVMGLFDSVARREHRHQLRAQSERLAVSETAGYLEWRRGPRLLRAVQVQTPMRDDLEMLAGFLPQQLAVHGEQTWTRLGEALADTHRVPFFHADLKGFHAFVEPLAESSAGACSYRLRWLDLARVSFAMTRRKRVINLYQALRFLLPEEPAAHERLLHAYCRASGWRRDDPEGALRTVRRFLAYKLRTHPVVE